MTGVICSKSQVSHLLAPHALTIFMSIIGHHRLSRDFYHIVILYIDIVKRKVLINIVTLISAVSPSPK